MGEYMCELKISDFIQIGIGIILFITLVVFSFNLFAFWKQNCLMQILNRPFCGVRQIIVKVITVPPSTDVIGINAIIVNSGNDYARDAVLTSELYAMDKEKNVKTILSAKASREEKITILPKQEFETFLLYIPKNKFNELVGGYTRIAHLEMTIQYKDLNNRVMKYSCSYLITKLLTDKPEVNVYEVVLQTSNLETL
jgi:hypothetical protein